MLRDQYELDKFFNDIASRASEMEPILVEIDHLLDDEVLYQMVKADMSQRRRLAHAGRGTC